MGAEADEMHVVSVPVVPRIELAPQKENAFPQRAAGARRAPTFDLDHGSRELDDAGVEVHRASGREVIGATGTVHERAAHDPPGRAEYVLRPDLSAVHHDRELRLDSKSSAGCNRRAALGLADAHSASPRTGEGEGTLRLP